ncbi:hypothetical protein TNCV_7021 [Trichonephila clavipes]|nr:hypothetical protein TNCV_7021 [Trichonephila clavipes]
MLRRLVGTTAPGHIMIVQFRNEKVSNHGSIPITIDCNVVAFIVFEEGFHQPIKRTKQSVFLDPNLLELRYPIGQGIGSRPACHEFEPSTPKDPPCWEAMSRAQTSSR